ncbi:SLATT domain-containing protein [Xanthobacter flavus]|uniref:SLATT domain-containing protein n=1 Tax=Xanthobacter flavus TaxID=281 RepID=UPI00372CAE97
MAEDVRDPNSNGAILNEQRNAIVAECRRQEEACLYTSTALYAWLRWVRWYKRGFTVAPVVLTAIAGLSFMKDILPAWGLVLISFAASLIPSLADALEIETSVKEITRLAAEFKALQDRFRRVATITTVTDLKVAEQQLSELMDRMDLARSTSIIVPEWAFAKAREKIEAGHYNFAVDAPKVEG